MRQRLHAAAGELDQVLLQRAHAERVLDLVVGELAVRAVGVDEELAVAAEERRRRAGVGELRVGEIAQHRLVVGDLHREVVVRALPRRVLRGVAAGAGGGADEARGRRGRHCGRGRRRARRRGRAALPLPQHRPADDRGGHADDDPDDPGAHASGTPSARRSLRMARMSGCGGSRCRRPPRSGCRARQHRTADEIDVLAQRVGLAGEAGRRADAADRALDAIEVEQPAVDRRWILPRRRRRARAARARRTSDRCANARASAGTAAGS